MTISSNASRNSETVNIVLSRVFIVRVYHKEQMVVYQSIFRKMQIFRIFMHLAVHREAQSMYHLVKKVVLSAASH